MFLLVILSAISLFSSEGAHLIIELNNIKFILHHSDNLSFPFAIVFHIAAFLIIIYGSHVKDWREQLSIISYSGAAIAALHAGDLFTLFFIYSFSTQDSFRTLHTFIFSLIFPRYCLRPQFMALRFHRY